MIKQKILAVGGATASGKSSLAVSLAKKLNGEIVSCDSMQVYKYMNIGTAKPTEDEMCGIPHHMIDVCRPTDNYSAADWASDAERVIEEISARGHLPIICGGTGMYLDALLRPSSFSDVVGNDEVRNRYFAFAEINGNDALHQKLREIDPISADAIHPNNVKRVVRALEIFEVTGKTKTEYDKESNLGICQHLPRVVTLDYENRSVLYDRINLRVDKMIDDGLVEEVKFLWDKQLLIDGTTAAQAIGYKEMLCHIKDNMPLYDAIELIKKNTRNYAKRQITWFARYKDISVVPDGNGIIKTSDGLADEVISKLW